MVVLTAGMGQLLKSYLQQSKLTWAPRPLIALPDLEDGAVFPGKCHTSPLPLTQLCKRTYRVLKERPDLSSLDGIAPL